jgi:hypothetical protein
VVRPDPPPASIAVIPPPAPPPAARNVSIAAFDVDPPAISPQEDLGLGLDVSGPGDLAAYSDTAHRGALSEADRATLEMVGQTDPTYSRARILLYEDAKARDDASERKTQLDAVMAIPENQYNPTLLVEQAELAIERGDYRGAVDKASQAERQWARLPSELIFSRKAMIYEIQAAGWQGVFYTSGGDDLEALDAAIRSWVRYQRHVETKERADLASKADEELAKLYDMQRRLE